MHREENIRFKQIYPLAAMRPKWLKSSWWIGHIPFAFELVRILRPKLIVELGVYTGTSFFAFCQAVRHLRLDCRCFGVDNWIGDIHFGQYGDNIYEEVYTYYKKYYSDFAILMREEFNLASRNFLEGSIDLLHIDGTHTYEAIQNDFYLWLPKMSSRGVVLLHDTNVKKEDLGERARDYQVGLFFSKIKDKYPYFEFLHSYGLGVLLVGNNPPVEMVRFLQELQVPECLNFFISCAEAIKERFSWQKYLNGTFVKERFMQMVCVIPEWLAAGKIKYKKVGRFLKNTLRNSRFRPYRIHFLPKIKARRPRLLHCLGNFHTGGSSRLVVDLFEQLGSFYEQRIIVRSLPVLPHYLGFPIKQFTESQLSEISSYIRDFRPDFLHVHYWGTIDYPWYKVILNTAETEGIPVIENVNIPTPAFVSKVVYKYVYVSNFVQRNFPSGTAREQVIYPGTDYNFFKRNNTVEPTQHCVGMVYRLERDKLSDDSIDVFIKVAQRNKNATFLIVGNGSLFDVYRNKVKKARLISRFRFTGYIGYRSLPSFYEKMTLFVAPVHTESFGQVVPMAMGMAVPVAGYNVGAIPEILADETLLAAPGDSNALSEIVLKLLEDKNLRLLVSQRNLSLARERFSLDETIRKYKALYEECLKDKDMDF